MTAWRSNCVAMCLWLAAAAAALGQVGAPRADSSPDVDTIHVYSNLLQIPVLILNQRREPLPPIDARQFSVRLGDYPAFKPRMVRRQGDDPITLAVLVDGSAPNALLPGLAENLPATVRSYLHAGDRIIVYGMDGCKLRRFGLLGPANAVVVENAVNLALSYPTYDVEKHGVEPCAGPVGLWDAMSYVVEALAAEPGRRVLLAISNGLDGGSKTSANAARANATRNGVAVFSIAERYKVAPGTAMSTGVFTAAYRTSPLVVVSEGSGGMILEANRKELSSTLERFVELLRGRYIVEFSRPQGIGPGTLIMVISCGEPRAFIRAAGTSMPSADPFALDPAVERHVSTGAVDPAPASAEHPQ